MTKIKVSEIRPKGMGLGADKSLVKQMQARDRGRRGADDVKASTSEEALTIKMGACVRLDTGQYGKVGSCSFWRAGGHVRSFAFTLCQ